MELIKEKFKKMKPIGKILCVFLLMIYAVNIQAKIRVLEPYKNSISSIKNQHKRSTIAHLAKVQANVNDKPKTESINQCLNSKNFELQMLNVSFGQEFIIENKILKSDSSSVIILINNHF